MINTTYLNEFNSPIRQIGGKVELFSSTEPLIYTNEDNIKSITIDKNGELGKFFGFGISQKATVNLIDKERIIELNKNTPIKVYFKIGENDFENTLPRFYIDESKRDEKTNELTVVAYDALNAASAHRVSELNLAAPYTIGEFAAACAALLGIELKEVSDSSFDTSYETGANFEGTETIREALNAIAEATQTIYYLDSNEELIFKRLDIAGEPVLTITNEQYMELTSKPISILSDITSATELGDNVSTSTGTEGVIQYVRNNPFWELRDDIDTLLENAIAAVGGTSITPFNCSWRGNFLLEIGDKIGLITKDNETIVSYFLNDALTYNGGLSSTTQWEYTETNETASNPTSLGEALKQTFARVDKANKQIELVAGEANANSEAISSLQLNTDSIAASVVNIQKATNNALSGVSEDVAELTKRVDATITAEDVQIQIQTELVEGTNKVKTNTGFTFDDDGLTVEKSDSEMSTQITEDGMTVSKSGSVVLTANNTGVEAVNLTAKTYLIVGNNSRFEDYGNNRTGCFWIGG